MPISQVTLHALPGIPVVAPRADLAALLAEAIGRTGLGLLDGDVIAVAQKIVSKAENRFAGLAGIEPTEEALALAAETGKDPRLVQVILSESVRVVRRRPGLLIMEHRLGFIMANAGVDHSNVLPTGEVLLLPVDPDGSAAALRSGLAARFGVAPGIVITDSFGRAWRRGTVGVAIGVAGLPALVDLRGQPDLFGRVLEVSLVGLADEIAAAASLLMGQADEGQPAVLLRGLAWSAPATNVTALLRTPAEDLFR